MKFNIENIKSIALLVCIFIILVSTYQCSSSSDYALEAGKALLEAEQEFETYKTESGDVIAEQKEVIINKNNQLARTIADNQALVKATRRVRVHTKTVYRDVIIDSSTVETIRVNDTVCAVLPLNRYREFEWLDIGLSISEEGLFKLDSMSIRDSISLYYGYDKWEFKNIFKKREPKVVFSSANPNVEVLGMQNITIEEKGKRFTLGLQAGYGMTRNGLSPYVGLGLNINLTR